jgi:hypothetical protein
MRDLTRWEVLALAALAIGALFYAVYRLRERLPPHDPPPDGPTDNNLLG